MPYLIDPSTAALAIQAKCGGSVAADNEGLLAILDLLLPRIEDLMDVASLTFGETTDTFEFEAPFISSDAYRPKRARVNNGYLVNSEDAPITITNPNGDVLLDTEYTVDLRYGLFTFPSWLVGTYTITYSAGFTATEGDEDASPVVPSLFEDVPAWIEGVIVTLLTTWYRTVAIQIKVAENVAYEEVMSALYRELAVRVYKRYMRPRGDVIFPVNSVRADGMLT